MNRDRKYALLAVVASLWVTGCTSSTSGFLTERASPSPEATIPPAITAPPPIITSTPTVRATLTAVEREAYVLGLLKSNAGCQLPCWWGIVPSKSTWVETEQLLLDMGARVGSTGGSDNTIVHGTGGFDFEEQKIYNRIGFIEQDGIIDVISVETEAHLNPTDFQTAWAMYSPQRILMVYGQPSRVWLQSSQNPPTDESDPKVGYGLWLFYDRLGFFIEYSGVTKLEPVYQICPMFEQGNLSPSIKLFLQAPDNQVDLEERSQSYQLYRSYFRTLEEATGLSLEQFYELVIETDPIGCIETPQKVWK